MKKFPGRDWVALVLALALFCAVLGASVSVIYATVHNETRQVSDAATQFLLTLFGGIVAILGAYVGGAIVNGKEDDEDDRKDEHD